MTQERRLHHAVLICITVMERGNWASSSRLHLHLVTEEEEVPSSDSGHTAHTRPVCVVTRTEDQEQWVAVLHWRLCIMFSSTLAINLVASAKFYFLSGGHLATDRTLKIVSIGCSTSRWPERRRARRLCSCGDQRTTRGGQMRGRARGVLAPTTNTTNTRCRCCF